MRVTLFLVLVLAVSFGGGAVKPREAEPSAGGDGDVFLETVASAGTGAGLELRLSAGRREAGGCSVALPGARLPEECSPPYRWCGPPLVVTVERSANDNRTQILSFLPLSHALAIHEAWYDGERLECNGEPFVLAVNACSPTLVFRTQPEGDIFTLCSDLAASYLALYSVPVNYSAVNVSTITLLQRLYLEQTASNALPLELGALVHPRLLAYWTGGSLYKVTLGLNLPGSVVADVPCAAPPELQYAGGSRLAALCAEGATYYDFRSETTSTELYNSSGYPVFCTSTDSRASVFAGQSRIDYVKGSTFFSAALPGSNFTAGYCVGGQAPPLLLVEDAETGVWAVNLSTNTSFRPAGCQGQQAACQTVVLVVGRLVVVGGWAGLAVLDSGRGLSGVVEVADNASLAAVIVLPRGPATPPSLSTTSTNVVLIAAPAAALAVAVAVVAVAVVVVVAVRCKRRRARGNAVQLLRQPSDGSQESGDARAAVACQEEEEGHRQEALVVQGAVSPHHAHRQAQASAAPTTPTVAPLPASEAGGGVDVAVGHCPPLVQCSLHRDSLTRQFAGRAKDNKDAEDLAAKTEAFRSS